MATRGYNAVAWPTTTLPVVRLFDNLTPGLTITNVNSSGFARHTRGFHLPSKPATRRLVNFSRRGRVFHPAEAVFIHTR
jgi:hypothetical protein